MKRKKNVIKIAKWKLALYLGSFLAGVVLSVVLIILAYRFGNDPLINYFLGFSSSLIITVIFAYLLELISLQEQNDKRQRQRNMYLMPVKRYAGGLLAYVTCCDWPLGVKRCYTYAELPVLMKRCFDAYCVCIEKIAAGDRTCKTINEAYNYKQGIQQYTMEPLMTSIDNIVNNQFCLIADNVFTEEEIQKLHAFRDSATYLKLPFMDELKKDRNIAVVEIDYPKEPVNDIVKNNFDSAIKRFMVDLEVVTNAFDELKSLRNIKFESR